ncbi:hypothetical protein [Mesorhizobium sp. L103C119B0]|uniref:hypothetical protein n=1 Tax=Mesorhizobium sp. L103C119B0 TaxID=1287085 RepID=UPI0018C9076F|nr:hypothetical protein [Mesorhizobium sp. L103C119B0]
MFVLGHLHRRLVSPLKLGEALLQAGDTRFEFRLVDDAFGAAVDQPAMPRRKLAICRSRCAFR